MNISMVPVEHIFTVWNQVRPLLAPALDRSNGRWTTDHLCAALCMGRSQLWIAYREHDDTGDAEIVGAMTSEVANYPGRKILAYHFIGGKDFDNWYPQLLRATTAFARDMGCDGVEGVARFGFDKWLKHDGFTKSSAFYEKDLRDG